MSRSRRGSSGSRSRTGEKGSKGEILKIMSRSRSKQKCYDIPKDEFIPLAVIVRTVLETPDEEVPIEVLDDVIKRVRRFKPQPKFVN